MCSGNSSSAFTCVCVCTMKKYNRNQKHVCECTFIAYLVQPRTFDGSRLIVAAFSRSPVCVCNVNTKYLSGIFLLFIPSAVQCVPARPIWPARSALRRACARARRHCSGECVRAVKLLYHTRILDTWHFGLAGIRCGSEHKKKQINTQ